MLATFATRTFIPMYTEVYPNQINYEEIKLVDYEGSLALELELKKLALEATAHYNVPVGLAEEQLSPFTYFSVHVFYSLYFK